MLSLPVLPARLQKRLRPRTQAPGDVAAAIKDSRKGIRLDPNSARAPYDMWIALKSESDRPAATETGVSYNNRTSARENWSSGCSNASSATFP